jgi:flagellar biosynthesis/type III secretory pathway chaperone
MVPIYISSGKGLYTHREEPQMIKTVWIENLIKVLEYERKLYGRLLHLSENKTSAVVNNELENLQEITVKEQELTDELKKLADVRDKTIGQIGRSTGNYSNNITVTDLISLVPDEYSSRLSQVSQSLKETINKLKNKNDLNMQLIKNALEYVDFSLNLLTQPVPQAVQYGRKGNEEGAKSRGVLDIKY